MGWMKVKQAKARRQAAKRAWARPLSVKSGIQPNREVVRQYQDTVKGLGVEIAEVRFPNVAPGRREIMDRLKIAGDPLRGILTGISDPLFVTIVDNSRQRCRLYWNSKMTCFILQLVNWDKEWVRLSITYATSDRAKHVWMTDQVTWKKEFSFRKG